MSALVRSSIAPAGHHAPGQKWVHWSCWDYTHTHTLHNANQKEEGGGGTLIEYERVESKGGVALRLYKWSCKDYIIDDVCIVHSNCAYINIDVGKCYMCVMAASDLHIWHWQEMISAEFANLKGWRTLAAQSNFRRMLKKGACTWRLIQSKLNSKNKKKMMSTWTPYNFADVERKSNLQ